MIRQQPSLSDAHRQVFRLEKTESISMDTHLTEVREIAYLLEEVDVNNPKDIIVYYTLKNLPKEYEIFKRMHITNQTLPTYEQLEAKLISEETSIMLETQQKEDGEVFFLHRDRPRRPQPTSRYGHPPTALNSRHYSTNRRYIDSEGSSALRYLNQVTTSTHLRVTEKGNTPATYQPHYRSKGPNKQRSNCATSAASTGISNGNVI